MGQALELWTFLAIFPGLVTFGTKILPSEYRRILSTWNKSLVSYFTPYAFVEVPESYGAGGNEIYDYVQTYLSSSTAIAAHHVSLCRPKNATYNTFALADNESIHEEFMGAQISWTHHVSQRQAGSNPINWRGLPAPEDEKRIYTLKIRKEVRSRLLEPYVEHVIATAKNVKDRARDRLLYTNVRNNGGYKINLTHPHCLKILSQDLS